MQPRTHQNLFRRRRVNLFVPSVVLCVCAHVAANEWGTDEKIIPPLPSEKPTPPNAHGRFNNDIDRFIAARWDECKVRPAKTCDDLTFARRVYLDLTGAIPTLGQVGTFLDGGAKKRADLIDELLKSDRYADHWAVYWGDLLREQTDTQGADFFAFRDYLRHVLSTNVPYNQWVRQMLTATGTSRDNPATTYFLRNDGNYDELAISTSQVFLGTQLKCAQCHDHPYEAWKQDDFKGLRAFFKGTRHRQAFYDDVQRGQRVIRRRIDEVTDNAQGQGRFPTNVESPLGRGRAGLADLVTARDNPYFARVAVNRLWAQLLGEGFVNPPDMFSVHNPPSHPELLDWLALEFIERDYDLKAIIRLICNSRTYQLATTGGRLPSDMSENERLFHRRKLRRMTAEQLHDSILVSTGLMFPRRTDVIPAIEQRYPAVPGSFLDIFDAHDRATIHDRPTDATIPQALALLNGQFINEAVRIDAEHPIARWLTSGESRDQVVDKLFMQTLTRWPTGREKAWILQVAQTPEAWSDVHWSLINTREFMFIR